eukprot:100090_1
MTTILQRQTDVPEVYSNLYAVFGSAARKIEQHLLDPPAPDKPIFEKSYKVKSLQEWDEKKAIELENGNRIIAPDGELKTIVFSNNIETELILQILNPNKPNKISHCSVLEWTAPDGIIYVPSWMIKDFCLQNTSNQQPTLVLRYYKTQYLKGSIIEFQPHKLSCVQSDEFKDAKQIFEKSLKKYQCLTIGDTLRIKHNNNIHLFEVKDVISAQSLASITPFNVVSLINTDVCPDFLPPMDIPIDETNESRIDAYDIDIDVNNNIVSQPIYDVQQLQDENNEMKVNNIFNGTGNRLDSNTNEINNADLFDNIERKELVIDESQPITQIQIVFIGNRREVVQVNCTTTVQQIYAHCRFISDYDGPFKLLAGFRRTLLTDFDATVQGANLNETTIRQQAL